MNKLIEFIDRLTLDEKLYWRMPRLAADGQCEVQWRRDARPNAWSIRPVGTEEWTHCSKGELPRLLERFEIDPIAFERQVGASILTQAVFADMVMEGAIDLFGHEAVRKSIADTRSFLTGVSEAAKRLTGAPGPVGKTLSGPKMPHEGAKITIPKPKTPKPNRPGLKLVALAWTLLALSALAAAPRAQAADAGHAIETNIEVDDVACASFAQILLPTEARSYLPFVGAGLAFHTETAASYATQVLASETFRFALAIGLVKNL